MLLLLLACGTVPCDDWVGRTRADVRAHFVDVRGETGHHTLVEDGQRLSIHVADIPDDSVAAEDWSFVFDRFPDGTERVRTCRVHPTCARGWSFGTCS